MENNSIETTTKHITEKKECDFPYKARKLFGLLEKYEVEEELKCHKKSEMAERD